MLDTHARKYVNPFINVIAKVFVNIGFTPNGITILALLIGLITSVLVYLGYPIMACICLWVSGLLDAVDGAVARYRKQSTAWGTLLDIVFDRLVEIGIILSLALIFSNVRLELLILIASIIFSMTVFLTVGALSENKGIKSFYYQAGLVERTEGFIMFTFMILFSKYLSGITLFFALLVAVTALQRIIEARRLFSKADV
ncbi:CDP-alcohol phosphatidyltransferase family protein [Clostridium sp. ZS2-4]|uniref:CDP-alcohol phosphatidyltransferase family protein n=1 Tax=Clostridium sp. ZS2-4 TaxID=2987703 RepID=UPI00227A0ADA|nr:CDP-alcohol phosphatidyltransferase family protein [Clostridium sp. ZS2-4]MCY6355767.1 CDP-alcohol phosphatidyltransferase family protein [Clostridium sp. ZS2-4]